jgi:hypothetical protein
MFVSMAQEASAATLLALGWPLRPMPGRAILMLLARSTAPVERLQYRFFASTCNMSIKAVVQVQLSNCAPAHRNQRNPKTLVSI